MFSECNHIGLFLANDDAAMSLFSCSHLMKVKPIYLRWRLTKQITVFAEDCRQFEAEIYICIILNEWRKNTGAGYFVVNSEDVFEWIREFSMAKSFD